MHSGVHEKNKAINTKKEKLMNYNVDGKTRIQK